MATRSARSAALLSAAPLEAAVRSHSCGCPRSLLRLVPLRAGRARPKPATHGLWTGLCWPESACGGAHCVRPAQPRVERAHGGRVSLEGCGGEGVELVDRDAQRVLDLRLWEERGSAKRDAVHCGRRRRFRTFAAGSPRGRKPATVGRGPKVSPLKHSANYVIACERRAEAAG